MAISVKVAGAYAAAVAYVKHAGTYEEAAVAAKVAGAYVDVGGAAPPPAPAPSLDFSLATNSQYLALVSVGGM